MNPKATHDAHECNAIKIYNTVAYIKSLSKMLIQLRDILYCHAHIHLFNLNLRSHHARSNDRNGEIKHTTLPLA